MRLVVFGASGGTGTEIVRQALGHGHEVTAFMHENPLPLDDPRVRAIRGDVRDFEQVLTAVRGNDAVASALGFSRGPSGEVLSAGIANVIHAMAEEGVSKLAAVSAAGTFARDDRRLSLGFRIMMKTTLRAVYDDLERMEQRIMASDLDWTIIRPVGLTDGAFTGTYRFSADGSLLPKASRISRADVAAAVLKGIETDLWSRRAVVVAD